MKCQYCGGEIRLDDLVCPYCGRPNEEAKTHAEEMRRFRIRLKKTEEEVRETAGRTSHRAAKIAVIAILLVGIAANVFIQSRAYSFYYDHQRSQAVKHAEAYQEVLDAFLEKQDYVGFSGYSQAKGISFSEDVYEAYLPISWAANRFRYVMLDLMRLVNHDEYVDLTNLAQMTIDELEEFYEQMNPEKYSWYEYNIEETEEHFAAMQEQVAAVLVSYFGMGEEDAAALPGMTKGERTLALEKVFMKKLEAENGSEE